MKKIENKRFSRLNYGVFICTLLSAILCFVIGDNDMMYDKYITSFYGDGYGRIISVINQKVIISGVDTKILPVLPLNVKVTLIAAVVFVSGCVAVQIRKRKSIFYALGGCLAISFIQWWLIYKEILYIPIVEIIVFAGFTYIALSVIKKIIYSYNTKNLPIGAVVKFVKNIVNMESETTYANYLLSNKNIIDNKIVISNADRKINEETFNKINKRTKLDKNAVLISTVGTIGKTVVLSEKPNLLSVCASSPLFTVALQRE